MSKEKETPKEFVELVEQLQKLTKKALELDYAIVLGMADTKSGATIAELKGQRLEATYLVQLLQARVQSNIASDFKKQELAEALEKMLS